MTRIAIIVGAIVLPGLAVAHPEHHSGGDFGFLHFATDPFHVGLMVVAVLGLLAVRRSILHRG